MATTSVDRARTLDAARCPDAADPAMLGWGVTGSVESRGAVWSGPHVRGEVPDHASVPGDRFGTYVR